MLGVLLAASCTALMVGTGGGGVPPVVIVPAPVKVSVTDNPSDAEPVRVGKDPVAVAYAPAPPEMVAEPLRVGLVSAEDGIFNVPLILSVPPVSAMVKGTL